MRNKTTVNSLVAVSTYFYGFYTIVYRENENWFMLWALVETTSVAELRSACCHSPDFLLQRMMLCFRSTKGGNMPDPTPHPSMTAECFTWVHQCALPLGSQWLQSLFDSALRDLWYHPGRSKLATRRVCRLKTGMLKMESLRFCLHWRVRL